ncbi:sensor domain-containing diguanylate cyclase [Aneurinibacillus migulanus]|uniref:Diguanylate cyclase (GGDEF) domain-containing protein n=1 Tax=Aneurinibacillus migulanus TaxID=47500 RepID=A0A1G8JQT6_ANEMI|nr:diguanylate cyclase [Aneurinibacillus migulanus]MED0891700.1 diguanylate cyclase [Aneurinibacillus migulanus]MED1617560.1 diguanylate cyclase [Aneurinibacillus migulanus]GED13039.1 hypothetical protein AMI01nite_10300 [Aneurinibacillus migulanus]SDI32910.1 diguanylate cyclase (GGDEF) domain-containing protein [Aneurinibacillus migulanus]
MSHEYCGEQTERHIRLLRLLNELNVYIAEETELERALVFTGETVRRALGAGMCVALMEEQEQNLQVWVDTDREESRYCFGLKALASERQVLEDGAVQILYPQKQSVRVTLLPLHTYGTLCLLPIQHNEKRHGVLYVFHEQEMVIEGDLLEFLEGVAARLSIAVYNWQQQQDLQYQRRKLQLLYDMMAIAADADKNIEDVLELVHRQIAETFHCSRVIIGLVDEAGEKIVLSNASGKVNTKWAGSLTLPASVGGDRRHEEAFRTGLPVVVKDGRYDERCGDAAHLLDLYSGVTVPIMYKDNPLGVIYADNKEYRRFTDMQLQFLTAIARQLGTVIMNVRQYEHIKTLAVTDGLTGLHTRQYFSERYAEEYASAERYNMPLCLVMIDIDDFKKINDTYGHVVGDNVLVAVSHMVQRQVRAYDIVARYGGEELILLLPRTQLEDAYRIVERIRMAFRSLDFSFLITASIGLAAYPYHAQNKEELLMLADDAMYRAKHQGKDRIKIAKNKLGTV